MATLTGADGSTASLAVHQTLPRDLFEHIFSFLSVAELQLCMLVCKRWKSICDSDSAWLRRYQQFRDVSRTLLMANAGAWRQRVRELFDCTYERTCCSRSLITHRSFDIVQHALPPGSGSSVTFVGAPLQHGRFLSFGMTVKRRVFSMAIGFSTRSPTQQMFNQDVEYCEWFHGYYHGGASLNIVTAGQRTIRSMEEKLELGHNEFFRDSIELLVDLEARTYTIVDGNNRVGTFTLPSPPLWCCVMMHRLEDHVTIRYPHRVDETMVKTTVSRNK
jgi:hypothetical protein